MVNAENSTELNWWRKPLSHRFPPIRERQEQVFLLLTIVIGVLTGLAVVALILLAERLGMRLYPVGSAAWRRMLIPILRSLGMGYLLFRYFPDARGSGVPQTKAALFARDGKITAETVLGKFFCSHFCQRHPARKRRPSVQVGAASLRCSVDVWERALTESKRCSLLALPLPLLPHSTRL